METFFATRGMWEEQCVGLTGKSGDKPGGRHRNCCWMVVFREGAEGASGRRWQ